MSYRCIECGKVFTEFGYDPETNNPCVCPKCHSNQIMRYLLCDCCGNVITDTFARTKDGYNYCDDCYRIDDVFGLVTV